MPDPADAHPASATDVYLNGRMVPAAEACIPFDDGGFQHAVGLFETMAAYHGRVFRLQEHLERLAASARTLGLANLRRPDNLDVLAAAVRLTLVHNGLEQARVRLTLTPGPLLRPPTAGGEDRNPLEQMTVMVVASWPTVYDPAYFEKGILALVAPAGANPMDALAGHKTLSYWGRLRTLRQAAAMDAGEAIWLNVSNHLASGAISNVFLVKDGRLLTPIARGEEAADALRAPVLPGVTRAAVMELAEAAGIEVARRMLSVNDLLDADEVFLTNSSWQILPVTRVEKRAIGAGGVGAMTKRLRNDLLSLIERETGDAGAR